MSDKKKTRAFFLTTLHTMSSAWGFLKRPMPGPSAYNSDLFIGGKRSWPVFDESYSKFEVTEKRLDSDDISCFTVAELRAKCPMLLPKPKPPPVPGCPANYGPVFQGPTPVYPKTYPGSTQSWLDQRARRLSRMRQFPGYRDRFPITDDNVHNDPYWRQQQRVADERNLDRLEDRRDRQDSIFKETQKYGLNGVFARTY